MSAADLDIGAAELDFDAFSLLVGEKMRAEIGEVGEDIGTGDVGAAGAADEVEDGATTASGAVDLDIDVADLDFGEFFIVGLFERVEIGEVDESRSDRSDLLLCCFLCFLHASNLARCDAVLSILARSDDFSKDNYDSDFVDVDVGVATDEDAGVARAVDEVDGGATAATGKENAGEEDASSSRTRLRSAFVKNDEAC